MMHLVAEFTIEPFEPAAPGPHVRSAIDAAEAGALDHQGVTVEIGPFGTTIQGPASSVLDVVATVNRTAIESGASRVSFQLTLTEP